ncbi:unnamed protein product [Allacma fusca]|uniref:Uncharacterized protein n=1 Tax=Allacma fusca TaxID=39272 RepID=A0A8J2LUJ7_9HEXA|nr:unnamed protein product [Allacma fusca]
MPRDPEMVEPDCEKEPEVTDKLLQPSQKPDVITAESELNRVTNNSSPCEMKQQQPEKDAKKKKEAKTEECYDCTECHEGHCCFPFCYCICCGWCDELECCAGQIPENELNTEGHEEPEKTSSETFIQSLQFFLRPRK